MSTPKAITTLLAVVLAVLCPVAGGEETPTGFLGDGTGHAPAAQPVTTWSEYRNEKSDWGVAGQPFPVVAAGNRLLVRTWFDLYCLGDPGASARLAGRR